MRLSKTATIIFLVLITVFNMTAQSSRPMVSDIDAQASGQNIVVTWTLTSQDAFRNTDGLIIYRSRQAFSSGTQLSDDVQLATLAATETSFTDTTCGIHSWYYAVTARYSDGTMYDLIIPTVNATVYAAGIASPQETVEIPAMVMGTPAYTSSGTIREMPLPYLHLFQDDEPLSGTIEAESLEEAAKFGLNSIIRQNVKPYVFTDDEDENSTGDTYTLHNIIDTFFKRNDWASSETELKKFLQTNKSNFITARAQIYTGQALFFQGKYREALSYFMQAEKSYPALDAISKRWIQYSLDYFELPDNS